MPSRRTDPTTSPDAETSSTGSPAPRARLTLSDVAAALNVSRATVSNAFNRPDQLSVALRTEILAKSRELGYFGPDPAARALRRRELREVAVIYHHGLQFALDDPLSLDFLRGVSRELDRRELSLQLIPKLGRDLQLSAAFQTTADALIVYAEIGAELAPEVIGARKPLVLVDTVVAGVTSISIDDRQGATLAMAHVLAQRPERLLALCFTLNPQQRQQTLRRTAQPVSPSVAVERRIGFVRAARQAGYDLDRIDWVEIDDSHPESAADALIALRHTLAPATRLGIVAMTDRMALSALREVRGWSDIVLASLVGFDDIPAAAEAGLTTIRQDARRKGELAVQVVLDGLQPDRLPVELVIRST